MKTKQSMPRGICALTLALLFSAGAIAADSPPWLEFSNELRSDMVVFPGTAIGNIDIHPCPQCKFSSMRLTSATRYFVGAEETTFDVLTKFVRSSAPAFMMVFYRRDQPTVTKITVDGHLPAAKSK